MIVVPAAAARAFRSAARKLGPTGRGPAPPVLFAMFKGNLALVIRRPDATLRLVTPAGSPASSRLVIPFELLARVDGDLAVEARGDSIVVRRPDGVEAAAVSRPVAPVDLPVEPARWQPLPPGFATAFHEAAKTTAREPSRYALHRVQLCGRAGQVIASDAKQALIQKVALPFTEDVLVAATGVFGTAELTRQAEWRVGRTDDAVAVAAGPWCVWLTVDKAGRYPDVAEVVTPAYGATKLTLGADDAARLRTALRDLPGAGDRTPVTLDLGDTVCVRARGGEPPRAGEVILRGASFDGRPAAVAADRGHLARALALGFVRFRVRPGKPLVALDDARTYLSAPLADDAVVPAADLPSPFTLTEEFPMKPKLRAEPADEPPDDDAGLWADALALRNALAEIARCGLALARSACAAFRRRYPLPPDPGRPALPPKGDPP